MCRLISIKVRIKYNVKVIAWRVKVKSTFKVQNLFNQFFYHLWSPYIWSAVCFDHSNGWHLPEDDSFDLLGACIWRVHTHTISDAVDVLCLQIGFTSSVCNFWVKLMWVWLNWGCYCCLYSGMNPISKKAFFPRALI